MRRTILASALLAAVLSVSAGQRFSYVFARSDGSNITLTHGSLEDVLRLQKRFSGAYLWASRDGRQYLIRDAAVLDEVRRAAAGLEALGTEQRALDTKMKPVERRHERLERELDALTDREDDEDETPAERARIRELENQLRDLERELRPYENQERRLENRERDLERVFDAEVERIVERAIRNGTAGRVD